MFCLMTASGAHILWQNEASASEFGAGRKTGSFLWV
jgi:hypothetical protein